MNIRKTLNIVLDFIFPRAEEEKLFTNITVEEIISKTTRTIHDDKNIITLFSYNNKLIRQIIWSLKFRRNKRLAKILAQILYDEILENLGDLKLLSNFTEPILIPIPLSKKKLNQRGFNQSELIAKEMQFLDNDSSFVLEKDILIKIKDTPPQSRTKNKKEREKNLKGCFEIKNHEKVRERNILLLDDVTTTGATLNEAKKVLKQSGVRKIICLTIAH